MNYPIMKYGKYWTILLIGVGYYVDTNVVNLFDDALVITAVVVGMFFQLCVWFFSWDEGRTKIVDKTNVEDIDILEIEIQDAEIKKGLRKRPSKLLPGKENVIHKMQLVNDPVKRVKSVDKDQLNSMTR